MAGGTLRRGAQAQLQPPRLYAFLEQVGIDLRELQLPVGVDGREPVDAPLVDAFGPGGQQRIAAEESDEKKRAQSIHAESLRGVPRRRGVEGQHRGGA
jgi:hypothetical protein